MGDGFGDDAWREQARGVFGRRHRVVGVGAVDPTGTRVASWGAGLDADYEIGSVSKGVTGLLYVDALDRGEIDSATTLADCLPLAGTPVGAIPLSALAVHRSGLRTMPSSRSMVAASWRMWRDGTNPYPDTLAGLLEQARGDRPGSRRPRYSNLGFELLGHAVAARAGASYRNLLRDRVSTPLGLDPFYAPATSADFRPGALPGRDRRGRALPPWFGEALAPAGGIRATVGSLTGLVAALLDGTAPGLRALDPTTRFQGRSRIGAGWITAPAKGRRVTWHNGGTGGFRSWVGMDRDAGTGVVVLTATNRAVDLPGLLLLAKVTDTASARS